MAEEFQCSAAASEPVRKTPASSGLSTASSKPDWTELVQGIERGEEACIQELYRIFARGIRFFLRRQLGSLEMDSKVDESLQIVVQAIQRGDLRDPGRLTGFVRNVVRRQVAAYIDKILGAPRGVNPVPSPPVRQKIEAMKAVLREMQARDREILSRFYLKEQTPEQICSEMKVSPAQLGLLKSRAVARFGVLKTSIHKGF